ncbi:MAG: PASTA domain-containing protein [Microthrixaceae bacterium]
MTAPTVVGPATPAEPQVPWPAADEPDLAEPDPAEPAGRVTEVGDMEVVDGGGGWGSLAVGLVVLIALMWLSVDAFSQRWGVDRDVVVPDIEVADFSGLGLADAQRAVEASGLVANVEFQANDLEEFPPGSIFTQRPLEGTKLAAGSSVTLIASSGPSQFVVPDVSGQELGEAMQLVFAIGLVPKPVAEYSDSVRIGEVLETRPRPGTEIAQNSEVEIAVSAGYAPRKVPEMVGKPAEEALNVLGRSGLGAGDIQTVFRRDAEVGTVVEISPEAGSILPRNSAVDVVIAGPPPTASVPSVEGLGRSVAEGALNKAGLSPRILLLQVPLGSPDDGRVISQGVPPQAEVEPGFEVELIVGRAPPPPTTLPPVTVPEPVEPTPTQPAPTAAPPPVTAAPTAAPATTEPPATSPETTAQVPVGGG